MRASAEIVVDRPQAAVWQWASDPRHWHEWQEAVDEARESRAEERESEGPCSQEMASVGLVDGGGVLGEGANDRSHRSQSVG